MARSRGTIWRYYAYNVTNSNGFYLPVGILYLQHQGFGLDVIGLTQGVFAFALTAAEIPTGYVGDRIGRRASLALASGLSTIVMVAYVVADSPLEYVALYVLWAIGWAFRSGTGDAWLYELLDRQGRDDEYARISGRASTFLLVTSAATAVAAGALVTIDWMLPFLANAALSALAIPILLTLPAVEPQAADDENDVFGVHDALQTLRIQAARPEVRWFVAYAALFFGLSSVTRAFEQPAATAVGVPVAGLGVLYAAFKLVSAGAASTAGWLEEHLGTHRVFVLLVPVVGVAYASTAFAPMLVVPLLFFNRSLRTVLAPIRTQYLNDRLGDVGRATVLSGASMVLSLAAAGANFLGGWVATATGPVRFLPGAGIAVAGVAGLLWLATSPVRSGGGRVSGSPRGITDAD